MSSSLQVATITKLMSGGYGRQNGHPMYPCDGGNCFAGKCDLVEMIDGKCTDVDLNSVWQDCDYSSGNSIEHGVLETGYSWRDSNAAYGYNSQSGRATVYIRDEWFGSLNETNNHIILTVRSKITRIVRDDIVGGGGANSWTRTSCASAYPQNSNRIMNEIVADPRRADTFVVNSKEVERTIDIAPQQTSYDQGNYAIYFRNWVTGSATWTSGNERSVDSFAMGLAFKNNLPNEASPPRLLHIDQTPRICDNVVDVNLCYAPPELSGYFLRVEWRYADQQWDTLETSTQWVVTGASPGMPEVCAFIRDLVPSNCEKVTVYWRAKYFAVNPEMRDSDWSSGEFETVFIPPIWMTTPDITTPECSAIGRGDLLDEYSEVVYYNGKPECKKGKC